MIFFWFGWVKQRLEESDRVRISVGHGPAGARNRWSEIKESESTSKKLNDQHF